MATNIDVTLKRYNGTDYDLILPTTHLGQLYTDSTLTVALGTYLNNTFINQNQIGETSGLATLNALGKLTDSQVPDYLFGGLKFRGVISANKDLDDYLSSFSLEGDAKGSYYIATADVTISSTSGNVTIKAPGDEGDFDLSDGIALEAGDWLVVTDWVSGSSLEFAVINNTYANATDTAKGLVTLSSATDTTGTSSKVITENVLGGLIGTTANTLAAGDHLHDSRYYTETEIQNFFSAATSISGYNKANWDAAYNDKINSASFGTTTGVVTLTQQDGGTVTVDLDGRYAEGITAAQTGATDGIDVVKTGNSYTIAHHDTSSQASVDNSNGTVIQDITLDTYGHITSLGSLNLDTRYYTETELDAGQLDNRYYTETELDAGQLDNRYYTETEIDNWIEGAGTINGNTYVPILYGAAPTSSITGAFIIDID